MVTQLQENIGRLESRLTAKTVKVKPPEPFDGKRHKLRTFLTQLDIYFNINRDKISSNPDKVLFASTYLIGPALDWFENYIRDDQTNPVDEQDEATKAIFASYGKFKDYLEQTFGDIDAARNAERRLGKLKQIGSASKLVSEFMQVIGHLDWIDEAFIFSLERMLKPEIQEKLIWMKRAKTSNEFIERVVKIGNKLHDFNTRQRGGGRNSSASMPRRDGNYRANDRRSGQPRSQGYSDPYRPTAYGIGCQR